MSGVKRNPRGALMPNGLPFQDQLRHNLERIAERVFIKNKAALVIIDGGVGEGKTTLAVHVADYFQQAPISFEEQYAMGGDQFQEKLILSYNLKRRAIIYDEAGDFAKHQAISQFNQQINRVFETYRAFQVVVILVLPCMNVLDNRIFDLQIPRLLLHVRNRTNNGHYSAYSLYNMFYLKDLMTRLKCKPMAYSIQAPNYRGHYWDLTAERAEKINEISIKGKLDIVSHGALTSKGLLDKKQLMKKLNRSSAWLFYRLKELEIRPATFHGNRAYYDGNAYLKIKEWQSVEEGK